MGVITLNRATLTVNGYANPSAVPYMGSSQKSKNTYFHNTRNVLNNKSKSGITNTVTSSNDIEIFLFTTIYWETGKFLT